MLQCGAMAKYLMGAEEWAIIHSLYPLQRAVETISSPSTFLARLGCCLIENSWGFNSLITRKCSIAIVGDGAGKYRDPSFLRIGIPRVWCPLHPHNEGCSAQALIDDLVDGREAKRSRFERGVELVPAS
jgi:hypothetical protein